MIFRSNLAQGCEPFDRAVLDAALGDGMFGGILASIGLAFFIYGLGKPNRLARRV